MLTLKKKKQISPERRNNRQNLFPTRANQSQIHGVGDYEA